MAALENLKDMNDLAFKPRMLQILLKEDVPNEKKQLGNPSKLSRVVSTIQTFKLLSESLSSSMEPKPIERWKFAVDDWVNRLSLLVSNSNMPDKCWAGICLLGMTCQECSSDRFLASYVDWFDKLLLHIQSPADSQFIKVASCTSISDLITRLAGFPNVKKDGTSYVGKLIQPVMKLLQEDSSENAWEGAIHLLFTSITCFPASVHRHYDNVEAVIASKILLGRCRMNVLKKLAYCLALLPKSRGDEDTWLSMMRKILLLINGYLTEIFHGLEEETKWDEAVRLLVPAGEVTATSLWGQNLLEETSDKARKRLKLSSVSTLMLACGTMLTTPYPTQVAIPVRSLLALVERVLMVDGSLPRATSPFVITIEQEFICSEIPVLHLHSLELLTSIIKGVRGQLLPLAAYVVRLVKEYFKRCKLSELRIKIYSIAKMLLMSMGVGSAIYLAEEVVNNSFIDLKPGRDGTCSGANTRSSSGALLLPCHRKRKHEAAGSFEQNHDRNSLEVGAPGNHPASHTSVKVAALEALEALLTVGGALRSKSWRPKVDNLLITMAEDYCQGGWANENRYFFLPSSATSTYADLQLATLRALLASLLSPSCVRPPHLAQSLELFGRGRRETGTKLSEFCSYALLALEVLIHPRALPLADFPSANAHHEDNPFSNGVLEVQHGYPDSDDLYESWLGGSNRTDNTEDCAGNNANGGSPAENLGIQLAEKISVAGSLAITTSSPNELEPAIAIADVEMESAGNEMIFKSQQFQESMVQPQQLASSDSATVPEATENPKATEMESTEVASETSALPSIDKEVAAVEVHMTDRDDVGGRSYQSLNAPRGTTFTCESDIDSSAESIPDIVDADPDSD